jgi:hypothetical protein
MKRSMWLIQIELVVTAIGMTAATVMFLQTPAAARLNASEANASNKNASDTSLCFSSSNDRATNSSQSCGPTTTLQATVPEKRVQSKIRQNFGLMLRLLNLKRQIATWIS